MAGSASDYLENKLIDHSLGAVQMQHLIKLGLKCERLIFQKNPQRDASVFVTITDIRVS